MKKFLPIIVLICLLLTSCSCAYNDLDKDLKNKVSFINSESVKYNEQIYNKSKHDIFDVLTEEDDSSILLGWNGLIYTNRYYSYEKDNPLFIYNSRLGEIYFRSDYNYTLDTFTLKNTNSSVIFSDLITEDRIDITVESDVYDIVLYSDTNDAIKIKINLAFVNGKYYAYGNNLKGFAITDEFEQLLIENGFIKK